MQEDITDVSNPFKLFRLKNMTNTGFNGILFTNGTKTGKIFISYFDTTTNSIKIQLLEPIQQYTILYLHLNYFSNY